MSQVSHIVSADTVFDERLAKSIPWPKSWPLEAESFLTPVVDQVNDDIDMEGQDRLTMMVDRWLEGNNPKSIDQVTLVKYLTGKVIEHVRVTRSPEIYAPTVHRQSLSEVLSDGFSSFPSSSWTGFLARSADQIALDPSGSPLDLSSMLVGVLRAAAVPARVVVCYDNSNVLQANERIHAIVEFAMYDSDRDQLLWIPVDPERLRDNGRRSNTYTQSWEYFGTHDQLHNYVPLAYYFHPPVNYNAFGYPALYGIRTMPSMEEGISQVISVDVMNSPLRADELNSATNP
ncbi:MAG: transglutaminase domain-containing protein [Phycisphaerales bacterium]